MKIFTDSIIDNVDVPGPGAIVSVNPSTGEEIATARALDAVGAQQAVESAAAAFPAWSATPVGQRQKILARWLEIMVAEADDVTALMSAEMGKPVTEAMLVDVVPACATLEYWHRTADKHLAFHPTPPDQLLFAHWHAGYRFDPLGVISIITPWNYPVAIPLWGVVPALVAGNTVVMKPASDSVLTGLMLADQARRAGIPPGVFNAVALPGSATGILLEHPAVAKVLFTGSVEVGRRVATSCAQRLLPCQLELGGNDAAVVAADAPLERTASGLVWAAFMNSGQSCASVERVYVVDEVYDRLVRRVVELTKALRIGDPRRPGTDLGPLANAGQRDIVESHVADAVGKGAGCLTGGERPEGPGFFYPPTVLVNLTDDMVVMREETFGPLLPMVRVADLDEAIRRANDSPFGLAASGWTRSRKTAERLQRELAAGAVGINEHGIVAAGEVTATWGGLGDSGTGRAHGPIGLHEVVNIKYVFRDDGAGEAAAWHYPYDEDFAKFLGAAVPMLYGRGLGKFSTLGALATTKRFWKRVRKTTLVTNLRKLL
jgi:succinate-semialdehyde dehydrogenase/glutarate-semialdehyde dehydrogenase